MKLSFREKKLSREGRRRILILCAVFLAALVFFEVILNYEREGRVEAMSEAKLPVVTMEACGRSMNELHGYTREMDASYMRDAVLPLESDRKLPITIHTYGYDVQGASYEIRSLDTERKIAETEIRDLTRDGEDLSATVQVENLVEAGEEYLLILTLQGEDGEEIYYYTRIMLPENCHEKECLDFATYFHETALGSSYSQLSTYLESGVEVDTETLSKVTINSTIQQVGWKGFRGTVVGEPVVEMKDINTSYVSLVFYYQIQRQDDAGQTHTYQVEEYFKVRYGEQRMYLLDYERTMEEYLNENQISVAGNVLSLGVTDEDFTYLSNETGSIVSFVQAGELYSYRQNERELTRVFSFIGDGDVHDSRNSYREHDIRILNMDESGNMDFVVYGYMNRGDHEGQCGINLYHYDSDSGRVEEQIFVAATSSYQILRAGFSDLLYKNTDDEFYIMLDGTLLKADLNTLETEEVISGLTKGQYAVSDSGRRIAWIETEGMAQSLTVLNLETGQSSVIDAPEGQQICPLAFMDEDLVYGLAYTSDISSDSTGAVLYPMYKLCIVDTASSGFPTVKEYQKDNCYILSVEKNGYTLYLQRAQKTGGSYAGIEADTIINSRGENNHAVTVQGVADEAVGKVTQITLAGTAEETAQSVRWREAELVAPSGEKTITMSVEQQVNMYYVYVGSRVTLATDRLSEAVIAADADMGIVVDGRQQYLWKRGRASARSAFSVSVGSQDADASASAQCISAMLAREGENIDVQQLLDQGETPYVILESALKDKMVLDLTGCSLSQVLYYVGQGNPVYARTGSNEAVLLVGYDASTVSIFDPQTGTVTRRNQNEASASFGAAGNLFISYVD